MNSPRLLTVFDICFYLVTEILTIPDIGHLNRLICKAETVAVFQLACGAGAKIGGNLGYVVCEVTSPTPGDFEHHSRALATLVALDSYLYAFIRGGEVLTSVFSFLYETEIIFKNPKQITRELHSASRKSVLFPSLKISWRPTFPPFSCVVR